jgi:hypothetical protein
MGNSNEIFGKSIRLEFVKRAAGMSSGLQKVKDWTLQRGRHPPKRMKSLLAYLVYEEPEPWKHRPLQELCPTMGKRKTKKTLDDGENLD